MNCSSEFKLINLFSRYVKINQKTTTKKYVLTSFIHYVRDKEKLGDCIELHDQDFTELIIKCKI